MLIYLTVIGLCFPWFKIFVMNSKDSSLSKKPRVSRGVGANQPSDDKSGKSFLSKVKKWFDDNAYFVLGGIVIAGITVVAVYYYFSGGGKPPGSEKITETVSIVDSNAVVRAFATTTTPVDKKDWQNFSEILLKTQEITYEYSQNSLANSELYKTEFGRIVFAGESSNSPELCTFWSEKLIPLYEINEWNDRILYISRVLEEGVPQNLNTEESRAIFKLFENLLNISNKGKQLSEDFSAQLTALNKS